MARSDLANAVSKGRLLRPRKGVYALADTTRSVVEALSHCGAVACISAGREFGLWILDPHGEAAGHDAVHTWIAGQGSHPTRVAMHPDPESAGCCVFHRDTPVDEPGLSSVGILHCLAQILRCRGDEAFFVALESGLRQGLITPSGRRILRQRVPRAARWLVDLARADADSGLESLLRLRLHRHGVSLTSQVAIPGVGQVDFVIGDCLIVEADGGTHDGPTRHRDRMRDAQAMILGFVTLRFDYAMIVHDWDVVERAVLAALARNLHRSPAGLTW